jgi:hypothetical protein
MTRRLLLATLSLFLLVGGAITAAAGPGELNGRFFFTGEPNDQTNKSSDPTARFGKEEPQGEVPITQTSSQTCPTDVPGHAQCAFWTGDYSGLIVDNLEFCWYWSSTNPEASGLGLDIEVTIFADPAMSGEAEPENIIGHATVNLPAPTPQPQRYVSTIAVQGNVEKKMLIQVAPVYSDTGPGNSVYYGAPDALSAFGPSGSCSPEGGGETLASPKATLGFKDATPKRGTIVKAKAGVKNCNKETRGTKIKLQRRISGFWRTLDTNKLDGDCRTIFKVRAKFKKAVFSSLWPKQSPKYKAGRSKRQTVTTHR